MRYDRPWRTRSSCDRFGELISRAWTDEYIADAGADPADLVEVDPGNGFRYTFDLAGTMRGVTSGREPRVVGVWGYSAGGSVRDTKRMRGHPRPSVESDDRGHLVACAAGGGYDINLIAMDATLNRGLSVAGARFRRLERLAAATPGALYFVRLLYGDDSARPSAFEVGVQVDDSLIVEGFDNAPDEAARASVALRSATPFGLDEAMVDACVDRTSDLDRVFERGRQHGTRSLTPSERAQVAGITGHVAESVVEVLLDDLGWLPLWHFTGPGFHGVDLVLMSPRNQVVAAEVKGTLVAGKVPRLTRRELVQMSAAWIDSNDNPGMASVGVTSDDIYGAVIVVNFVDETWRVAFTSDFERFIPVIDFEQLRETTWLIEE